MSMNRRDFCRIAGAGTLMMGAAELAVAYKVIAGQRTDADILDVRLQKAAISGGRLRITSVSGA